MPSCADTGIYGTVLQESRISLTLLLHMILAKLTTPSTSKWKAPTAEEKNCCVIDGKPMWWNQKLCKWVPDTKTPGGHAVATTPPTSQGAPASDATPATVLAPTQQIPSPQDPVTLAAYRNNYASIYASALQQLNSD